MTLHELADRRLMIRQSTALRFWLKFCHRGHRHYHGDRVVGLRPRWNAIHLETTQPFFNAFEFKVGLVLVVSVLILNWFHWGGLLTGL